MNCIKSFMLMTLIGILWIGCSNNGTNPEKDGQNDSLAVEKTDFKWQIDQFSDVKIMRYKIPDFEKLSLKQKELLYYLSEAAICGRDIIYDQYYKHNLCIRRTLEAVVTHYNGDKNAAEYQKFMEYTKKVWFSNGIHHHYSTDKFIPEFSKEFFTNLITISVENGAKLPLQKDETVQDLLAKIIPIMFDANIDAKRVSQSGDLVAQSACNFYENVNQNEAKNFYDAMMQEKTDTPISYGLNSKLIKEDNKLIEKKYTIDGMYGEAIKQIVYWLKKAVDVMETDLMKQATEKLIAYYETGDLKLWDEYNILWTQATESQVDFVNGFIEIYGDPLGRKATWESVVNFKNIEATKRAETMSANAQWFEDNSPVDDKFKKKEVKGVTAKVITVAQLGGDCYPTTPIGINLPNAEWIREQHGSKSVTMENITYAYSQASLGSGMLDEFYYSEEQKERAIKHGSLAGNLHTDLHECLGHGSGKMLEGITTDMLENYHSPLEETRADLFALYYMMDNKMIELGLMETLDVAKAEYDSYIINGLMKQLTRLKLGDDIQQAHMRNRQLIAKWCYEKGKADNVIEKKEKDGKTYFVINDYNKLRELFGELLKEVQRIKSEGDFEAGKTLVEDYGVKVDAGLHKEVLDRYKKLNLAPYGGFINPILKPVYENDKIVDVIVEYPDDYCKQMLRYSKDYSFLPTYN